MTATRHEPREVRTWTDLDFARLINRYVYMAVDRDEHTGIVADAGISEGFGGGTYASVLYTDRTHITWDVRMQAWIRVCDGTDGGACLPQIGQEVA